MNNAAIHAALDAVTMGLPAIIPGLEVFRENTQQDPQITGKGHVEVYFMPAPTQYAGLQGGKGQMFTGVYQLTLVTPPGRGTQSAQKIADQICDHFNALPFVMAGTAAVTFPTPAYYSAGMHDAARSQIPVTIMYSCCAG